MAAITAARTPPASSACRPAMVVPPGDATLSFNRAGCSPVSSTCLAAPSTVCAARVKAVSRGSPTLTPPSAKASLIWNTYAGPLPLRPVTASINRSSTTTTVPTASNSLTARARTSTETAGESAIADAPARTRQGALGITRTSLRAPPNRAEIRDKGIPAATDTMRGRSDRRSLSPSSTASIAWGLTARITTSAQEAAAALSLPVRTPWRFCRAASRSATTSVTQSPAGVVTPSARKPASKASPMFPPPMIVILTMLPSRAPLPDRARPEQRRPDAHQRGAFLHRHFEVSRHAHGQFPHRDARNPVRLHLRRQHSQPPEVRPRLFRRLHSRRDGHQSQHTDPLEGSYALDQAHQLIRTESMLGFFTRHVHFKKDRLREPALPGRSIEALGHLQPIHGMQQREASDRRLDLVRLERADQMPFYSSGGPCAHRNGLRCPRPPRSARRSRSLAFSSSGGPCAQDLHLGEGLLDAVLAEHSAPAGRRLAHALNGDRLRHGHQAHAPGLAPA